MPELRLTDRNLRERRLMVFAMELHALRPTYGLYDVANDAIEIVAVRRRVNRLLERTCNEPCEDGSRLDRAVDRWTSRLAEIAASYGLRVDHPGLRPVLKTPSGYDFPCPC